VNEDQVRGPGGSPPRVAFLFNIESNLGRLASYLTFASASHLFLST
jgi:hypothetical protein